MSPGRARVLAVGIIALGVVMRVGAMVLSLGDGTGREATDVFSWALLLTFAVGGYVIATRQPGNAIGWLFLVVALSSGLSGLVNSYAEHWEKSGEKAGTLVNIALVYANSSWVPFILIPTTFVLLLFPDGHLLTRRWRFVAWCAGLGISGTFVSTCLQPVPLDNYDIENPFGVDSPWLPLLDLPSYLALAVGIFGSATSMVLRFRRARGAERQQMKWIALAGAVAAVTFPTMLALYGVVGQTAADSVIQLSILALPAATAVAVLRYRLYDIDIVINRALVYGSLTASLAGVYVGSVLLLQLALSGVTQGSGLAVAASTLAVAALFRPVRGRIQGTVDRRFFRSRYDATRTLEAFGLRLRDEVDLGALSADLQTVVRETMRPAHVSLWLRSQEPG